MAKGGVVDRAQSKAMVQEKIEKKLRSKKIKKKVPKVAKTSNKMEAESVTKTTKINKIRA